MPKSKISDLKVNADMLMNGSKLRNRHESNSRAIWQNVGFLVGWSGGLAPTGTSGFYELPWGVCRSSVETYITWGNMRLHIHSMLSNLVVNQLVLPETVPKPPGTRELPGPGCEFLALVELSTGTRLNSWKRRWIVLQATYDFLWLCDFWAAHLSSMSAFEVFTKTPRPIDITQSI